MVTISEEQMRRIVQSTMREEQAPQTLYLPKVNPDSVMMSFGRLAFTQTDVLNNASADFDLAQGPPGGETPTGRFITAWNITGATIPGATKVWLGQTALASDRPRWYALPFSSISNASLRIRGLSPGTGITAGGNGVISGVTGINGVAPNPTEVVHHVAANFNIPGSVATWAEWNVNQNRFEVYQADCPP